MATTGIKNKETVRPVMKIVGECIQLQEEQWLPFLNGPARSFRLQGNLKHMPPPHHPVFADVTVEESVITLICITEPATTGWGKEIRQFATPTSVEHYRRTGHYPFWRPKDCCGPQYTVFFNDLAPPCGCTPDQIMLDDITAKQSLQALQSLPPRPPPQIPGIPKNDHTPSPSPFLTGPVPSTPVPQGTMASPYNLPPPPYQTPPAPMIHHHQQQQQQQQQQGHVSAQYMPKNTSSETIESFDKAELHLLRRKVEKLESLNFDLQSTQKDLRDDNRGLQTALDSAKEGIANLEQRLAQRDSDLKKLNEEKNKCISDLVQRLKKTEKELKSEKAEREKAVQVADQHKTEKEKASQVANQRALENEQEFESMKAEKDHAIRLLKERLGKRDSDFEDVTRALKERLAESESDLERVNAVKDQAITALDQRLAAKEGELEETKAEKEARVGDLEERLARQEQELERIKAEKKMLENLKVEKEARVGELEQRLAQQGQELEIVKVDKKKLEETAITGAKAEVVHRFIADASLAFADDIRRVMDRHDQPPRLPINDQVNPVNNQNMTVDENSRPIDDQVTPAEHPQGPPSKTNPPNSLPLATLLFPPTSPSAVLRDLPPQIPLVPLEQSPQSQQASSILQYSASLIENNAPAAAQSKAAVTPKNGSRTTRSTSSVKRKASGAATSGPSQGELDQAAEEFRALEQASKAKNTAKRTKK